MSPNSRLALPEIDVDSVPGGRLIDRALSTALVALAVLAGLAIVFLALFDLSLTVDVTGVLEPEEVHKVHSRAAGTVEEVLVVRGDRVKERQAIARLDAFALDNQLARLELEARHKRHSPRFARGEMELLEQSIAIAERERERLTVRAPAPGEVLTERPEELVGVRVSDGEPLFELGSPGRWKAALEVPEGDIHRIRLGDSARIEIPALAALGPVLDKPFAAELTFIGNQPSAEGTRRYRVLATFDATSLTTRRLELLKAGMSVRGQIITRSAPAVALLHNYLERQFGKSDSAESNG